MNHVSKLEELIGKRIIIETHDDKIISGKLVDYTPGDEHIKLSEARILGDFEKKPGNIDVSVSAIKEYHPKIEINRDGCDPFYTPRR